MSKSDILLHIIRVLEKLSQAIPVAGSPLQSIFGVATVVLETSQEVSDGADDLRRLACEASEFVLALQQHVQSHQDEIPLKIVNCISDIEFVLHEIERLLKNHSNQSKIHQFIRRSSTVKEVSRLSVKFDAVKERFSSLVSLDTRTAITRVELRQQASLEISQELLSTKIRSPEDHDLDNSGLTTGIGRKDFILGSLLSSTQYSESNGTVIVDIHQGFSTALKAPIVIKTFSSREMKLSKKFFDEETQLRKFFINGSILQIFGTGQLAGNNFVQVYHSPRLRQALPLHTWYSNLVQNNPSRIALGIVGMAESLRGWDKVSLINGFTTRIRSDASFGERASRWLCHSVVEEHDDGTVTLIYAGELISTSQPITLSPAIFVESPGGSRAPIYLALRRGLRYHASDGAIYPSLKLSLPALHASLSEQQSNYTFLRYNLKSEENLDLGDVGYIGDDGNFVVMRRAHHNLSSLCGVTPYSEPENDGFEVVNGSARLVIPLSRDDVITGKLHNTNIARGRHYQSELRTSLWFQENASSILRDSNLDLAIHELMLIADKLIRSTLEWSVQLKEHCLLPEDWSKPLYIFISPASDEFRDNIQVDFTFSPNLELDNNSEDFLEETMDISWKWVSSQDVESRDYYSCVKLLAKDNTQNADHSPNSFPERCPFTADIGCGKVTGLPSEPVCLLRFPRVPS